MGRLISDLEPNRTHPYLGDNYEDNDTHRLNTSFLKIYGQMYILIELTIQDLI